MMSLVPSESCSAGTRPEPKGRPASFPFMFFAAITLLAGCDQSTPQVQPAPVVAAQTTPVSDTEKFLERHWARPLAPQGKIPAHLKADETSLDPASCGGCHVAQFEGWRDSLHSRAMGPGILGQLANMEADARDEHQQCIRCHAPLAEQADSLSDVLAAGSDLAAKVSNGTAPLFRHGLGCAACHVRGWQWYGPPRRDGSQPSLGDPLPHGAWQASPAFEDSRFCAACHQFTPDQFALNGKLIENTYEEWKASRYAREGKTCQSCHMPDRSHLWRGIHDPEMTRSGITIRSVPPEKLNGAVSATLTVRNSGTGHMFPTYVTPSVIVEGIQEDAAGKPLPDTLAQYVIGRQVKLDLSEEIADTRLAPDREAAFRYNQPRDPKAKTLALRVRVRPDEFYSNFYRAMLKNGAGEGEVMIRKALADSLASAYILHEERWPLR